MAERLAEYRRGLRDRMAVERRESSQLRLTGADQAGHGIGKETEQRRARLRLDRLETGDGLQDGGTPARRVHPTAAGLVCGADRCVATRLDHPRRRDRCQL